jgi:tetratricopeptide (TPR) repeat protein
MPTRPLHVFLSHASDDKYIVQELYNRLCAKGIKPWLDEVDLIAGQYWHQEIQKSIRNSDVVIVCLSRNSLDKEGYIQKEILFALDVADEKPEGTIFIIPLKLEECTLPERLSHLHWINYNEDGFERLMQALWARSENIGITPQTFATVNYSADLAYRSAITIADGEYDEAIANLTHAIQQDPNEAWFYCMRGIGYFMRHIYNEAYKDFTHAIRLEPDEPYYYYWRSYYFAVNKDKNRAVDEITHAIELKPDDLGDYFSMRGVFYLSLDYNQAISDLTRDIELKSKNWTTSLALRGLCYVGSGDYNKAIDDISQAIELGDRTPHLREVLEGVTNTPWFLRFLAKNSVHEKLSLYEVSVPSSLSPSDLTEWLDKKMAQRKIKEQNKGAT